MSLPNGYCDDQKKISKIVNDARNSLGKYCVEECKSYCCRNGYLPLEEKSLSEFYVSDPKRLKIIHGKYSFSLHNDCPNLTSDYLCRIYKSDKRPEACSLFPVMVKDNIVVLSTRCPAIRENKLFGHMKKLEMLGCRIIECDEFLDFVMNVPEDSLEEEKK